MKAKEIKNIRREIPTDIQKSLLPDEDVCYYAEKGGCLSGKKQYLLITDSRVMVSGITNEGCLGNKTFKRLDIPLEHVTSLEIEKSGCLFGGSSAIKVSSSTASSRVEMQSREMAEEASILFQEILRKRRKTR